MEYTIISGGISGAIDDPYGDEAMAHAEMYYKEIRSFSTDVKRISVNTGIKEEDVLAIKNYLFMDMHLIDGEIRLFDANFHIAESWRRLAFDFKNVESHVFTLLYHELMEMRLVGLGIERQKAHDLTSEKYNYQAESDLFYEKLRSGR